MASIGEVKKSQAGAILSKLPSEATKEYWDFCGDKMFYCANGAYHDYICCDTCFNIGVKKAKELEIKYEKGSHDA